MSIADEIAQRMRDADKRNAVAALNAISQLLGESIESIFLVPVDELIASYEDHIAYENASELITNHEADIAREKASDLDEYHDPIFLHLDEVAREDESDRKALEKEFLGSCSDAIKLSNEAWVKSVLTRFGELIQADRRIAGFPNPIGLSQSKYCAKLKTVGHYIDRKTLEKIESGKAVRTTQFLNAMRSNAETLISFMRIFRPHLFFPSSSDLSTPDNATILSELSHLCDASAAEVSKSTGKKTRMAYYYKSAAFNPKIDVVLRMWANGIVKYTAKVNDWRDATPRRKMLDEAIPQSPLKHEEYAKDRAEIERRWLLDEWCCHGYYEVDAAREFFVESLMPQKAEKFETALKKQHT